MPRVMFSYAAMTSALRCPPLLLRHYALMSPLIDDDAASFRQPYIYCRDIIDT